MKKLIFIATFATFLTACGVKGPLYLPAPEAAETTTIETTTETNTQTP